MKTKKIIEEKVMLIVQELRETESALKEYRQYEFLSELEERQRLKLIIKFSRLNAQFELLKWILEL